MPTNCLIIFGPKGWYRLGKTVKKLKEEQRIVSSICDNIILYSLKSLSCIKKKAKSEQLLKRVRLLKVGKCAPLEFYTLPLV